MNAQKRLARLAVLTVLAAGGCGTSTTSAPPTAPPGYWHEYLARARGETPTVYGEPSWD